MCRFSVETLDVFLAASTSHSSPPEVDTNGSRTDQCKTNHVCKESDYLKFDALGIRLRIESARRLIGISSLGLVQS